MLHKYLKYFLKGIAIFSIFFLLIYCIAYIYISVNKKKIVTDIKELVADKLNGDVQLGDVDLSFFSTFPNLPVGIENILITDTLFSQHKHPFFSAEHIYAKINLIRLIKKANPISGIKIENGIAGNSCTAGVEKIFFYQHIFSHTYN